MNPKDQDAHSKSHNSQHFSRSSSRKSKKSRKSRKSQESGTRRNFLECKDISFHPLTLKSDSFIEDLNSSIIEDNTVKRFEDL